MASLRLALLSSGVICRGLASGVVDADDEVGPSGMLFGAIDCLAFWMCLRLRSDAFTSVDALLEELSVRSMSCAS